MSRSYLYLGRIFSEIGQNSFDTRKILGIFSFLCKFIPNLSDATSVLRELSKADVESNWSQRQEQSFSK